MVMNCWLRCTGSAPNLHPPTILDNKPYTNKYKLSDTTNNILAAVH